MAKWKTYVVSGNLSAESGDNYSIAPRRKKKKSDRISDDIPPQMKILNMVTVSPFKCISTVLSEIGALQAA